jgi:hypothetical protein
VKLGINKKVLLHGEILLEGQTPNMVGVVVTTLPTKLQKMFNLSY